MVALATFFSMKSRLGLSASPMTGAEANWPARRYASTCASSLAAVVSKAFRAA
jgi:hypothetical protein